MSDGGLAFGHMPPLAVPTSFFLAAPVAMTAAGLGLAAYGPTALSTHWSPVTLALVHLLTLGVVGTVMVGATYQLVPVIGGRRVPAPRVAHVVHALLAAGLVAFLVALLGGPWGAMPAAVALLASAFTLFVGPIGLALARRGPGGTSVAGMRLALASLVALVVLGTLLALRYPAHPDRAAWLVAHVSVALLGWVGAMMAAVSWRVLPMFYLAPFVAEGWRRAVLALIGAGLGLVLVALATSGPVAWAAAPAAIAVWGLQPVLLLRSLAARRRPRSDASLLAWRLSLACAPLTGLVAVASVLGADPRGPLLFGWLALWGWAGLTLHGMLTRIVPFLVRYHMAVRAGAPGPSLASLLPERRATIGVGLHALALLVGAVAIGTGDALLARATGMLVALTGLWLGTALVAVLTPPEEPTP